MMGPRNSSSTFLTAVSVLRENYEFPDLVRHNFANFSVEIHY